MGSRLVANGQLATVDAPDATKKSVLQLIATSVRHQSLNVFPILPVLINQTDQLQVLLDSPLTAVNTRLQIVLVVVPQLLMVTICIIS